MSSFDDFDWTKFATSVATQIPAMYVASRGSRQVAKANQQAAQIAQQNQQANIAEIRAGNERAAGMLQPIASTAQPALEYMRSVMARPATMFTPQQEIELNDRMRTAKSMVPTSMRGSARVNTAMIDDVMNRARAGMVSENQRRSDQAASSLGSTGVGATTNMASIASGQGPQVARENTGAATAMGNAITGTAASNADTMGTIASFFANSMKDQERESRYRRYKEGTA